MPTIPHSSLSRLLGPRARLLAALLATCGLAMPGCAGSARIYSVPFVRTDFPPQERPVNTVEASEAYYWLGEDGELNIALRQHSSPLFGLGFESEWTMSLVLEAMPAGSQRLYTLDRQSVRTLQVAGPIRQRGASLMGVAVIHAERGRSIEGRFHANVRQQNFAFLAGWSPDIRLAPVMVLAGTFHAGHDPERGRAIRERTESDDFGRDQEAPPVILIPPMN